jgi:hypothetical protein
VLGVTAYGLRVEGVECVAFEYLDACNRVSLWRLLNRVWWFEGFGMRRMPPYALKLHYIETSPTFTTLPTQMNPTRFRDCQYRKRPVVV